MTSRCALLPLLCLLVTLSACRGPSRSPPPAPAPAPETAERPLLPTLQESDPATRRAAAETLGRLTDAPRLVIDALLAAQWDEDESVAAAAVAALDRIQPDPEVAVRVPFGTSFESVGEVLVRAGFTTWERVDCEPAPAVEGERLVVCWRLVEVPPVYQTRIKQATPTRFVWREPIDARIIEESVVKEVAAVRALPPPPEVPPRKRVVPPEGEPEGAEPGQVWGRHETPTGATWRRHPECE